MNAAKNMTPRLLEICGLVKGKRIADVGTDHAYIPIYLMQTGVIDSAIAMDINVGPLTRAKENINKFLMQDKISTRLSDGLRELNSGEVDEVVIAGMGGILICDILEAGKRLWDDDIKFILQPMTAAEDLRKYLVQNGFVIEAESIAKEDNKLYQMMRVSRGKTDVLKEVDYYINPILLIDAHPLVNELLDSRIYEFKKILKGLKASGRDELSGKVEYVSALLKEMYDLKEGILNDRA